MEQNSVKREAWEADIEKLADTFRSVADGGSLGGNQSF